MIWRIFSLLLTNELLFFQVGVFFGGLAIAKDETVLKSNCPNVVVGTPGRILALVRSKKLNLKNIKHFILDECDKMLEQLGKIFFYYKHVSKKSILLKCCTAAIY